SRTPFRSLRRQAAPRRLAESQRRPVSLSVGRRSLGARQRGSLPIAARCGVRRAPSPAGCATARDAARYRPWYLPTMMPPPAFIIVIDNDNVKEEAGAY